ncbi:MAG: hypothetical protein ACLFUU_13215 [Desulfobacteraceae bacterium]
MVPRVSPQEVYPQVKSGSSLLVCAYDSDDRCQDMQLEGALMPSEFKAQVPTLPKQQEIIFYCA